MISFSHFSDGRNKIHKNTNDFYFELNYGKVTLTLLSDRYQFSYICNPGYKLIGEKIIWFFGGEITHSQPICIRKYRIVKNYY